MKILHSYLFFSIKYAGGTSDLMCKILRAQAASGANPVLLSGDYKFDETLFRSLDGVKCIKVKSYFDKQGFSIMPFLFFALIKNRNDFDFVHMHIYRTFQSAILYLFCKIFNKKFVIDAHGAVPYHKKKIFLKKLFDILVGKRMLRDAHLLIAETEVGKTEYLEIDQSLPQDKIAILSPPFETDPYEKLPEERTFRKKFKLPKEKKLISFLGRLHPIKGNDFLIRGFSELLRRRQDCHLVLIGPDDGHEEELKKLIASLGIDGKVTFTGFMGGAEKNEALAASSIVVQLSRFEQGAWAPIEGVLCGTPIVVTEHTGTGEDVKRLDAGYLVEIDNIAELANTFEQILGNYETAIEKTLKARNFIMKNMSMKARVGEYYALFD